MSPILNGMETDKFKPDFTQEDKSPTAILLSHVYDLKGICDAIYEVLSLIRMRHQKCYYGRICGSQYIQDYKLSNACIWLYYEGS